MSTKFTNIFLIILAVSLFRFTYAGNNTTYRGFEGVNPDAKQIRWAEAAFNFTQNINCDEVFFTTEKECRELTRTLQSDMNIYIADVMTEGRLVATLPDASLSRSGIHDAIVALDPYPQASFGHLIIAFFVDVGITEFECTVMGGIYLGNGECLSLALKNRCLNLLERKSRRRNFARRCELNFLPLVHLASETTGKRNQRLSCRSNIPGFAPCPELRPENETSSLICNPLVENTQRCSTTHETVHTRCRLFEICDQAILLSGGWDRFGSQQRHKKNIHDFYHMLRHNGFHRNNIKVFFANGALGPDVLNEDVDTLYPSAMKLALRYHLKTLCQSPHCVDTLVLYLNGPTKNDGSILLWDADGNGEADDTEVYSLREFMSDLKNCAAHQVYVIADQSYAGELVKSFQRSKRHNNVVIFASGKDNEYSWNDEFTQHWVNFKHTHTCMRQVFEASQHAVRLSNPIMSDNAENPIRTTICGAPCDIIPPFTHKELQENYLGCQNLPTTIWLSKFVIPDPDSMQDDE